MLVAVVVVGYLFFSSGQTPYTIRAQFENASQLVKGNLVQVGGTKAGLVKQIDITPAGLAEVQLEIDEKYAPLRVGTRAVVRQASLSGIANRYVDLQLAPDDAEDIEENGLIKSDSTVAHVDLDQLFNTLDPEARKALQAFFRGGRRQFQGRGDQANAGFRQLNPALTTSSRLFNELNRDTPVLERFIVDSAKLVTALAEREDDLTGLVSNLNETTRAIGDEKAALASAIGRLPDFMRRSNTTFLNLRGTLDDVDPLVAASRPVARRLGPFLKELRLFARDARPTVRDLSVIIRRRGADNDLIDLTRTAAPLARVALDDAEINGKRRRGAFPEITEATRESAPIIAQGRPYTPDLLGWFDDFSHTGQYDALGGFNRFQVYFNAFSTQTPGQLVPLFGSNINARPDNFRTLARLNQHRRCPGAAEEAAPDGSNVWSPEEAAALDCDPNQRATGNYSPNP